MNNEKLKQRLMVEREDLEVAITNLNVFLKTKTTKNGEVVELDKEEEELMEEQLGHMRCYFDILSRRIQNIRF